MEIKWHGTASIEMKNQTGRILFDPFVPLKGSAVPVKIEDYDGINDIFITHGHLDHIVSLPMIFQRNSGIRIYCTKVPYRTLMKKGIPESNLVEIIDYLNPKEILLDHFDDTFPPITEPVDLCPVLQKYQGKIEVMQLNRTELR